MPMTRYKPEQRFLPQTERRTSFVRSEAIFERIRSNMLALPQRQV